ncbi:hypothetical protein JTE90_021688 [Oedothorax gibbosus]|uniref:AGC-kinase C-terminal domain-containing protein n=1 Tax=Oedothorax gibbosus TaxID=931172 RepID=A0AAV6TSV9_9ARAC|nr:hypothetical protein JTE90_021688 [Oedothorax gibbosus]
MPWQDLLEKKVTPPFKPQVTPDTLTKNSLANLSPPDNRPPSSITEELEQPYFHQFSFHGRTLTNSIDQQ